MKQDTIKNEKSLQKTNKQKKSETCQQFKRV